MSYRIVIKPLAEREIREAKEWYEADSEKIGEAYMEALDKILNLIGQNPKLFAVKYRVIRMGLMKRFPYAVHYLIEEDKVVVLSVMHTRRKPRK